MKRNERKNPAATTGILVVLLISCGALPLAACGQSGVAPSAINSSGGFSTTSPMKVSDTTTGKIDPCSLITKEEAKAALGGDVKMTPGSAETASVCSYTTTIESGDFGVMYVEVGMAESPMFQKFDKADDRYNVQPLSGIGDRALLITNKVLPEKRAKAIRVLKGNAYVSISMNPKGKPASIEVLRELVAKALSRLSGN